MHYQEFTEYVLQRGMTLYRDMPWRRDTRGYYVLVSELMLQQTQVERVVPKFEAFVERFPNFQVLAAAPLADVLRLWSGLGYNRRAKYLHDAAKMVASKYDGELPATRTELLSLPGVGSNTAGALLAYVYNQPVVFVETNVRTVYFHHFFEGRQEVSDTMIHDMLAATLDTVHPREFYWALMDYGSWLKRSGVKNIAQSRHYRKQSPLAGSIREVRGAIVRNLTGGGLTLDELRQRTDPGDGRFDQAYRQLVHDGLINQRDQNVRLTH